MSKLSNVKLTDTTRSGMLTSPLLNSRAKLIAGIKYQIAGAKAEFAGETLVRREKRWVTNAETGERSFKEVPIRFRPWWWRNEIGIYMLNVKYGAKRLELRKGMPTIEVGVQDKLIPMLELMIEAVEAGELDKQLEEVRKATRKKLLRK